MKTRITLAFALFLMASTAFGQVSLRITYDASQSGAACQPLGATELAMHSGASTDITTCPWAINPYGWGVFDLNEMTSTGTDTWELIIDDINAFYNGTTETITDIGLVFHNAGPTPTLEGKSEVCNDIFIRGISTGTIVVENADALPFAGVTAEIVTGLNTPIKGVSNISISPNPATDAAVFTFSTVANNNYDLIITNAVGQQVATQQVLGTQAIIERAGLPAGLYFATLVDASGARSTKRFVFN